MDPVVLFPESMATALILVTKPFSLCKLAIMFPLKIMFIAIHTWIELLVVTINFHLNMFWKAMVCFVGLILFPGRVLTALPREKMLEDHLLRMQIELDNLIWERKELHGQLQTADKEIRILESVLAEVEEENDKAIAKIEFLEVESWKSDYKGTEILFQDLMMQREGWEGDCKSKAEFVNCLKAESTDSVAIHQVTTGIFSRNLDINEALIHSREAALSQSLFSAVLSLLVGMIIWEAEDPCMPLVVALFTVVGMSLKSVVQFFSTIKNKPASDAVALLSINWFILGTLTYPTLPRVAHILAPWALSLLDRTVSWLGISSC
ncbi:uncharacterized protein LOC133698827 isoform X2 [Populus nigra]|uniref:uncharacterized protein LOC133698827 isoform X2 n=1 Tax=Populus nigra TaxID=3691 RepID=UPI002B26486B|nr:uncharacterized protein LOC133698827 isoform X2 [Populus nigra]